MQDALEPACLDHANLRDVKVNVREVVNAPAIGWSRQCFTEGLGLYIASIFGWLSQPSAR